MLARCSKYDFRNLGEIHHRNRYPDFFHRKFFSSKKIQNHFGRKKKLVEKYFLGRFFSIEKKTRPKIFDRFFFDRFFSTKICFDQNYFRPKKIREQKISNLTCVVFKSQHLTPNSNGERSK